MTCGMKLLVVFFSIAWVVDCRHIDGESHKPCAFGDQILMDCEVAIAVAEKCLLLVCRDGMIVQEMVGNPMDTGCCMGFDNVMVSNGYKTDHCMPVVCENGTWVPELSISQCCGHCQLFSNSHFVTFDFHHYQWHGVCNYTLLQHSQATERFGIAVFTEMDRVGPCATVFSHTTFRNDPDTIINITKHSLFNIDVNGDMVTVPEQGMHFIKSSAGNYSVLAYRRNQCLILQGSSKLTLRYCPLTLDIWAPRVLSGSLAGLCGLFNYDNMDDFTTPSGQTLPLERYPLEYPETWRADSQTMPMCMQEGVVTEEGLDTSVCNGTKGNKCHAEPAMIQEYKQTCENALEEYITEEPRLQFYVASCVTDLCLAAQGDIESATLMSEFFITILNNYMNISMQYLQYLKLTPPLDDPSTCASLDTNPIPVVHHNVVEDLPRAFFTLY